MHRYWCTNVQVLTHLKSSKYNKSLTVIPILLIILRFILSVVLKLISKQAFKIIFTTLLLLKCTSAFHLERKHIECVKAE